MMEDRRQSPRYNIAMPARLWVGPQSMPITVYDLSTAGCGLKLPEALQPGLRVLLRPQGHEGHFGKILWCREGRASIKFDQPLIDTVVDRLRHQFPVSGNSSD